MTALRRGAGSPAAGGLAAVLVCALAAFVQTRFNTDADVAWLIDAAGRMLDGAVPYRDIIEPNPPASILLYVPGVLLARATGLPPGVATDIVTAAMLVGGLCAAVAMLARAGLVAGARANALFGLGLAVLLILPFGTFGQREHMVTAMVLPALACLALRHAERAPGWAAVLAAGLGAGLAIAVKPVFGLALVGPVLDLLVRQSWRQVLRLPELWLAAAVAGLYGVAVLVFVPDYASRVLPLVVDIYLPVRMPLVDLVRMPSLWVGLLMASIAWQFGGWANPFCRTLCLAAAGLAACFLVQGKGFPYQALPEVLIACLAAVAALVEARPRTARAVGIAALRCAPALLALQFTHRLFVAQLDVSRAAPGLREAVAALPGTPRLLSIGNDSDFGALLTQQVGAAYVGSAPIAWVTLYAGLLADHPERDARFAGPIRQEQALFAADIDRARPDVLLIEDADWLAWADSSPALRAAMAGYAQTGRFGGVAMFQPVAARAATADLRPAFGDDASP